MVRSLGLALQWVAKPQVAAGLCAGLFVAGGYLSLPNIVRPIRAISVPVIEPIVPRVNGISINTPVDCSKVACIALTFDDGPNAKITPKILHILNRHNVKATFFMIGLHVAGNEHIVRQIHQSGHEIGNHSWSHRNLSKLSPAGIKEDVTRAQEVITATGVPAPRLFRPPYGAVNAKVRSHIPMTVVSWSIDPEDWRADSPSQIVEHVMAHVRPGAIVDLHDIHPTTAKALDPILDNLGHAYHFVTVSELLSLPPGQPGIFYSR